MSDKRVVLGKLANNNYGLQISKAGVDVIDDTINSQDYLFNSEVYRAGTIRSNSEYSNITTSGVDLPTTSDSSGNAYIPAYIVSEKGAFNPQGKFVEQYGSGGSSGGTRTVTLVNCLNTAAGGGMFQFSLGSTSTTKNKVIPFFVDVDSLTDPRPGTGSGTYPYLAARSRSSSDGAVKIQILGIPCQFGKMTNSTTLFGNSLLTGSTPTGGGGSTGGGGVLSAPTVTGTSRTARNNTNDTISVSTSNGTNNSGTITYAQGSSNSSSGLTFQSSSSFSNHTRGTTKYYFAKQTNLVSANTGTNHVHASAAVDITPSGFGNLAAAAASGSAGTAQYTIAGLGTGDTASVSTSAGSVSPSSGVNGTTITFSLNATGNAGNTTSANITVGTTTRTFVVTTSDSITFNPSDFTNTGTGTSGVNPGATVTSNAITVGGIPAAAVSVTTSGCTVSIAGGSFVSSGTVSNNQTVTIRSTASSTFGAALNPSITVGSTTINQTVTTRTASVGVIPDSMTATQSTNTNANTQTVTCTASGGSGTTQFSNDNSNWGTGNTFTQTRNTTVTYYARKTDEGGTSSAISVTEFVPLLFVIGTYSNTSNVSASGGTISNTSSGTQSYMNIFSGLHYGTVSLSASATTNPSSMLSSVAINSIGAVGGTVASNSGSARTGTITVSATTSQGGSPSSKTFNVPQAAAASNLWEVGITQGGNAQGSGYSRVVAFFGNTTDATCDLFTGGPAWRFSDTPQASSNTIFSVNGIHSNSGWTSVKIYSGTSASGTLLATRLRSQASFSQSFLGVSSWDLGGDNTSTSGSLYLVFA
jgi:hypothetical protein